MPKSPREHFYQLAQAINVCRYCQLKERKSQYFIGSG
jgi:hypothetical protein